MADNTSTASTKSTPKSWRTCEITQDYAYGWTPENVEKFVDNWSVVKHYAWIAHTEDLKDDMSTPRDPHCHLMLRFNAPVPTSAILARAKAVGLPTDCITDNRIQKMKNWSAALNYLTHRDEHKPWKHIYDLSEVHSNFDWELDAESAHQKKQLSSSTARAKEIVDAIDNGTIREYNIHEHLTTWEQVNYHAHIKKAFDVYIAREKLKGEHHMEVMFISGASRTGKDTFAVEWCKSKNLDYYRTNNNPDNPFDDYRGQPVIIWSDARDSGKTPAELFNLLDNHWKSSQKARYSDINLDCKYMIITSVKPLTDWYKSAFANNSEPRKQLYARINTWFKVEPDNLHMYIYNESVNAYDYVCSFPNVYNHADEKLDTHEKRLAFAKDMLSGVVNSLNQMSDYIDKQATPPPAEPIPERLIQRYGAENIQRTNHPDGYLIINGTKCTKDGMPLEIYGITDADN